MYLREMQERSSQRYLNNRMDRMSFTVDRFRMLEDADEESEDDVDEDTEEDVNNVAVAPFGFVHQQFGMVVVIIMMQRSILVSGKDCQQLFE